MLWGFCSMALSNVTFHGYLVQPPNCTISDGETIELTFQDVNIDDINGSNYEQSCRIALLAIHRFVTLYWK